jgi:hypothetical protein
MIEQTIYYMARSMKQELTLSQVLLPSNLIRNLLVLFMVLLYWTGTDSTICCDYRGETTTELLNIHVFTNGCLK